MRSSTTLLAAAVLAVITACGPVGQPRTLVEVDPAQRPMPANAGVTDELEGAGDDGPDCGDPTASLAPDGLEVSGGSTMADIVERGRLIVGVDQNTNLFGVRNPATGELEGFDIDIALEIAEVLLGDRNAVQFVTVPVPQRLEVLQRGEVDLVVFTMTITCQRREDIEFSSVYFEAGQRVLVRKGSGIAGLEDLGDERVCAPRGSTSSLNIAAADPRPVLVETNNMADCLVLLQQHQVAAVSTDDSVLAGLAEQDPTTEVVGEPFSSEPYGIGIPKRNEDMVRYVNAVLDQMREDGRWQDIYDRWLRQTLGAAEPPRPTYR